MKLNTRFKAFSPAVHNLNVALIYPSDQAPHSESELPRLSSRRQSHAFAVLYIPIRPQEGSTFSRQTNSPDANPICSVDIVKQVQVR